MNVTLNTHTRHPWDGDRPPEAGTHVQGFPSFGLGVPPVALSLFSSPALRCHILFWLPALTCGCCTPEDLNTLIPSVPSACRNLPRGTLGISSSLAQRDTRDEQLVLTQG